MVFLLALACGNDGTVAPPGDDPARFDPVAQVAAVAAFAGEGAHLTAFQANGVRADGTVDLTSELLFTVNYTFERDVPPPADAPPVGAGGSPDGKYHESVEVRLWQPGQWRHVESSSGSYDYKHLGMERTASVSPGAAAAGLPAPACSLATLWKGLSGAPAGAVAFAQYRDDGWRLWVQDTPARAEFRADCSPVGGPPAGPE